MYDQYQTKTITIVDTSGKFIAQLNKRGTGPGEYTSIDTFSFDMTKSELITYDRTTMSFIFYSFSGA
ncbi:MAG: 6-bladed beta-propeller [Tenacibaculum sp.]